MSTLEERKSALKKARALLEELATTDNGVGAPENVRSRARGILRHLPNPDEVVDVLAVVQEYANSMDQADFGQAFALGMSERARTDAQRAEDTKSWLVIGTSLFVTVAFSVSAFFAATEGAGVAKVIWLSLGAIASGGFGALIAVAWLREGRCDAESGVEGDLERVRSPVWRRLARRFERKVSSSRDFGQFENPSSKEAGEDDRE